MKLPVIHGLSSRSRLASAVGLSLLVGLGAACKPRASKSSSTKDAGEGGEDCKPTTTQQGAENAQYRGIGSFPIWEYDGAPDPKDANQKNLVDLNSSIPYFPGISNAVYGDQMFRPAFGPIPWRMMQKPNCVKILFIGQDGTHIAEAAGRPATAGFGGRAQDLAKHFGVSSAAAFINTFAFTIRWQYGAFDTPFVITKFDGKQSFSFGSFTGTPVWLVSQDKDSPIVKWRNNLIEWIIRNNKKSLKMIVLFGGGARDAAGTFIESKGGKVGTRYSAQKIAQLKLKIAEFDLKGAGSNKQAATPFTREGKDLLQIFAQESGLQFSENDYKTPAKVEEIHTKFIAAFTADPQKWANRMVFPPDRADAPNPQDPYDGVKGSGMVHPAQLGGYDIAKQMQIGEGEVGTLSLKGLKLGDDYTVDHDIIVTQLPHPTALSTMDPPNDPDKPVASAAVNKALDAIKAKFPPGSGWKIDAEADALDPDNGQPLVNRYEAGLPYKYGRADMGAEYYDFGAPSSRMVNVSTASRNGANVIVFGTRDQPPFDANAIKRMTMSPSSFPSAWNGSANPAGGRMFPFDDEMWIARAIRTDGSITPSVDNRRYTFDAGPGSDMAKIMKTNLPRNAQFTAMDHGTSVNGDFGHYRGTFDKPDVVILADPDGDDDLITARALTGTRGQFLHGLMTDLGVGDRYLVIKTAPYSNYSDDVPNSPGSLAWAAAIEQTKAYREAVLKKVFETATPRVVLVDGQWAAQEFARIFPVAPGIAKVIPIARQGVANSSGIKEAGQAMVELRIFRPRGPDGMESDPILNGKMVDISRSHLSYYARIWEGTSGDRVITSSSAQYKGKAFAEVAPSWAYNQKFPLTGSDLEGCKTLVGKQIEHRVRLGQSGRSAERVTSYVTRMAAQGGQAPNPETICRGAGGGGAGGGDGEGATAPGTVIASMEQPDPADGANPDSLGADDRSHLAKYKIIDEALQQLPH